MIRRPVHVVYGGAHLYRSGLCRKLGDVALRTLEQYVPNPETLAQAIGMDVPVARAVHSLVVEKLRREPIEDYRIDFEDGYGHRSPAEEDEHVLYAAEEASGDGTLPSSFGIRIKPFAKATRARAERTLLTFVDRFRPDIIVTLPKIIDAEEVRLLVRELPNETRIELMIETPAALRNLRELVDAAGGRAIGAHFGPYDYTSSLGITAAYQSLTHPACDFARHTMQVALADSGLALADGPTTLLPIAPHRGANLTSEHSAENRTVVFNAWRLHYANVRRALAHGFYQGWDLHPAQLVTRYAAVFAFFHEGLEDASRRMRNFLDSAAQATRVGAVFDDAATGQGLLNFFVRGLSCGAFRADDLPTLAGVTAEELQTASFAKILEMRRA